MLAINQPRVSHLDRASRICSTSNLDKAAAWYRFISGSSLSGLNADFLNYRSALSNPTPQRRVLCYSLIDLREILFGCNRRYLEHLSALDDFSAGVRAFDRLTKPRKVEDKTAKGINFF